MPTTWYVLPKGTDPTEHLAAARAAGADQIAAGIPPALAGKLVGVSLPAVYVEPDPDPAPALDTPAPGPAEGPSLEERLAALEEVADLLLTAMLDEEAS